MLCFLGDSSHKYTDKFKRIFIRILKSTFIRNIRQIIILHENPILSREARHPVAARSDR